MSAADRVTIRMGRPEDMPVVYQMIKEAVSASGSSASDEPSVPHLLADLYESSPPWCELLVAERGGTVLGTVAYRRGYWSWSGRTLELIALFVQQPAIKKELVRRLILELCRLALAEHAQLDWAQSVDPDAQEILAQFGAYRKTTFDDHWTMTMPLDSIIFVANETSGPEGASRPSESRGANDDALRAGRAISARLARAADMPAVHDMINELAVYQEHPEGPQLTVKDLQEDGYSCASPWFFALVAERAGAAVGMVMGCRAWAGGRRHYLQNLYVRPAARRCGVADLLVKEFCKFSLEQGVQHVELHVSSDNAPALALYRRLRAAAAPHGPHAYRLERTNIKDAVAVLQSQL